MKSRIPDNIINFPKEASLKDDPLGLNMLADMLQMPEETFSIVSEVMLSEIEKALNNANDKLTMVQALNAAGMTANDFNGYFNDLIAELEKTDRSIFSEQKISFVKRYIALISNALNDTENLSKRVVPIAIELCHPEAVIPTYSNVGDAGMDVYAIEDITIKPGEIVIVPIGIKLAIPLGYELQVRPRSGLSFKTKLRIANAPGTIDSNYRGEIGILIENIEPQVTEFQLEATFNQKEEYSGEHIKSVLFGRDFVIEKGQRFAQLVLNEIPTAAFYQVTDINTIAGNRGGGFGSSGK